MIIKIQEFIKENKNNIILFTGVVLVCFLCFAAGFLTAKYQEKEPLRFEEQEILRASPSE
ncbi:MAG: hypothetical protein ISS87_02550 [Candidatus Pacebacteria bacterium]|nr:hypothetical protein [Candidatus Paceibacterota bacterium]